MRYTALLITAVFVLFVFANHEIDGAIQEQTTEEQTPQEQTPAPSKADVEESDSDSKKSQTEEQSKEEKEADKDPAKEDEESSSNNDPPTKDQDGNEVEENSTSENTKAEKPATPRTKRTSSSTRDRIIRNGETMRVLFNGVVQEVSQSTVAIKSGDKQIAMGSIVDENGFVLTKKSELKAPIFCEFADGSEVSATVFGIHEDTDLALLKIEKKKLKPIAWAKKTPRAGSWLVTTHPDGMANSVGVVSVAPRVIPGGHGFMGIEMDLTFKGQGALVSKVNRNTPAQRAGLKVGDIVIRVAEREVGNSQDLAQTIRGKKPGDKVELVVKRGSRIVDIVMVLGSNLDLNPNLQRSNFQNNMGGRLSRRRHDFPLAFQHDSVLAPNQCGGPVVNLDGQAIGVNVARSGRVSSLALPVSVILPIIDELKSGNLAPAIVNKTKIEAITQELKRIEVTLSSVPNGKEKVEKEVEELTKKDEDASKELADAIQKVKDANNALELAKRELERLSESLKLAEREQKRLERKRERLVTGIDN